MSRLKNTTVNYGWVSITLHWLMAVGLIATYLLGDFMVGLEYYDPWYHQAPDYHKMLGLAMGCVLLLRLYWTFSQPRPVGLDERPLINRLAKATHHFFYLAVILLVISGYLISTAKGKGIDIAGLFEIPALLPESDSRAEIAGEIHELIAHAFILLVGLHAVAALIHHFIFRDQTLLRMLRVKP